MLKRFYRQQPVDCLLSIGLLLILLYVLVPMQALSAQRSSPMQPAFPQSFGFGQGG